MINDKLFREMPITYFQIKNSCGKPSGIFPCKWKLWWGNIIDVNAFFLANVKDDFNEPVPSQRENRTPSIGKN